MVFFKDVDSSGKLEGIKYNESILYDDLWILEVDADGNLLENTRFYGQREDNMASMHLISEDTLLICGFTNSFGCGSYDMFVSKFGFTKKFDSESHHISQVWNRGYGLGRPLKGDNANDFSYSEYLKQGSFIREYIGLKFNWLQGFESSMQGYEGLMYANFIDLLSNGDYIMAGEFKESAVMLRLNKTNGSSCWAKKLGGQYADGFYFVEGIGQDDFITCGYSASFPLGYAEFEPLSGAVFHSVSAWVMKLDINGEIDNDKCFLKSTYQKLVKEYDTLGIYDPRVYDPIYGEYRPFHFESVDSCMIWSIYPTEYTFSWDIYNNQQIVPEVKDISVNIRTIQLEVADPELKTILLNEELK